MIDSPIDADSGAASLSPSGFMRTHRPELYSDTVDRPFYVLDRSMLEFQLETITSRNEHQRFEIFCRKLCERVICPNIRPQSGPEGGGDGKTDADTYPVAEAISELSYIGSPGPVTENWGFAFSATKDWKRKAARDVEGIAGTGRSYDRIYFVTSRSARAADRASLESSLAEAHGIPVTILDRAWIVNEVVDNERKDIAHDYLAVGHTANDPMRMGPEDYSRKKRLDDIERLLSDPANYDGMERQMVAEAMVAAQLSRNLELPRHESDGRHARAIRLAQRHGTDRQRLESRHDALWTAFWWFDDAEAVNDGYADIEKDALTADHARNIEFLVQLHQLLVNAVIYRMLPVKAADFVERSNRLEAALVRMTQDVHRPNHRLEARTSLAIVRLGRYVVEGCKDRLPEIWFELGEILDEADGLVEFDADRLVRLIEVASMPAGRDPTYRAVAERLADFVSRRTSEAEGALILLRQALRLADDERFECIRLLGRAAMRLAKREHSSQLVEAHQHLAIAYRGADLLWAARSSIIFAIAGMTADGEEDNDLPAGFVPTVKIWAWIALELRLVPELILAVRLMHSGLATIPLDDSSKERMTKSILELDVAFGSNILNMSDAEIASLSHLPDALDASGMATSRTALLYSLGHEHILREDGSIPRDESAEAVVKFMSLLKAQPVSRQVNGLIILNAREEAILDTCISGLTIKVVAPGDDVGTMLAQTIVAALEAVLATILEESVGPHTENFRIDVVYCDDSEPLIQTDPKTFRAMVSWPRSQSPSDFSRQSDFGQFLLRIVADMLAATFVMPDVKATLERLFHRGNAHDRVASVLGSLSGLHRLCGKDIVRIERAEFQDFPMRERPALPDAEPLPEGSEDQSPDTGSTSEGGPTIRRHRDIKVQSVIDLHSWDQARWTGIAYAGAGSDVPPFFALMFNDAAAARHIFERWRERFGSKDTKHAIYVSVIRRLPGHPPSHYAVQITSGRPEGEQWDSQVLHQVVNRVHVMEPDDDRNLESFIAWWRTAGCYCLAPAVMIDGKLEIITNLAILKRDVTVVDAASVGEHDIEHIALELVAHRDAE
ncbi:MAG: hypothetical protein ABL931_00470 [Usitatibacteraceae bacterium]